MSLPNSITLVRIFIIPFFITELLSYQPGLEKHRIAAFLLFLAASLTDALDGLIARAMKSHSNLGRILDPIADKLLLLTAYIGVAFVEALPFRPPLWVTVSIVFRDSVIIIGLLMLYLISGKVEVRPNGLGKLTTACQMTTLLTILLKWQVALPLCYITAILSILSCLSYINRDFIKQKLP